MVLEQLQLYKSLFEHWVQIHPVLAGLLVFLLTFTESLAVIGMLVPGSVLMTTFGALVGAQIMPATSTIVWAMAGAVAGDALSYGIGYYYKEHLREIWPFRAYPQWLAKGEAFFQHHGGKSVFLGRIGPLRAFVPIVAGMLHMRPWQFFAANVPSSILWAPLYMLPGILLGAASLELPPAVATRYLAYLFLILLVLWLCGWLIKRIFFWLLRLADRALDRLWGFCQNHPTLKPICVVLHDPYHPDGHGQLTLALFFIITSALFLILFCSIITHGILTAWDEPIHQFLRSLYTPWGEKLGIIVTLIGWRKVIIYTIPTVFIFLLLCRRWRAAIHWGLAGFLCAGSVGFFKKVYQSPRPPGLTFPIHSSSFPSGHTTLAVTLFGFLAVLIARDLPRGRRGTTYVCAAITAGAVGLSRLYLGAHWSTDVIGAILLGLAITILVTISYRRQATPPVNRVGVLVTFFLTLAIAWSYYYITDFKDTVRRYTPIWPSQTMTQPQWWEQNNTELPLYRNNRFGHPQQIFNVQWVGPLHLLKSHLKKNGWQTIHAKNLQDAIMRLAKKPEERKLPFLPMLYLGKRPVFIMFKNIDYDKGILVLRLWDAQVTLRGEHHNVWIGTVDYHLVHTHHLLHRSKVTHVTLGAPTTLLSQDLRGLHWRIRKITPASQKSIKQQLPPGVTIEGRAEVLLITTSK